MLKILGAVIVILTSFAIGQLFGDNFKKRITALNHLSEFIDYISANISLYKTPLDDIYSSFNDEYLRKCGFLSSLHYGFYESANRTGLLLGDEERKIVKSFDEKLGGGCSDDMVKLCSFTLSRLRNLEEQLRQEMPNKCKVYNTISILAGASAVIILI